MSGLYAKGREKFLLGQISWLTDDFKVVFVTAGYTPNFTTHEFLSDISVSYRVAVSDSLTGKTATLGWAGTSSIVWETVSGPTCTAMVVFKDTGDISASPLLAYINSGITNLPLDPPGTRVTFLPDAATGLFRV